MKIAEAEKLIETEGLSEELFDEFKLSLRGVPMKKISAKQNKRRDIYLSHEYNAISTTINLLYHGRMHIVNSKL